MTEEGRVAATPEPREGGWDELRREVERLPKFPGDVVAVHSILAIVDRLAAARGEPETLPRAEYARLKGIEDIARLIVSGWASGFPVEDGDDERGLVDRLATFIEEGR